MKKIFLILITALSAMAGEQVGTPGAVRVLAVRAAFLNSNNSCSVSKLRSQLFGKEDSVADYWSKSSGGRTTITGEVYKSLITINEKVDIDCRPGSAPSGPAKLAERRRILDKVVTATWEHLENEGIDPLSYDQVFISAPPVVCESGGRTGFQNVSTTMPIVSYNNCSSYYVDAHEFGHSFGLAHANGESIMELSRDQSSMMGYPNYANSRVLSTPNPLGAKGPLGYYPPLLHESGTDVAGWKAVGLDAINWAKLGYFTRGELVDLTAAPAEQRFELVPLNGNRSGIRAVRVKLPGNLKGDIFISYRKGENYDKNLSPELRDKVVVHQGKTDDIDPEKALQVMSFFLGSLSNASTAFDHPALRIQLESSGGPNARVIIQRKR